MLLESDLPNYLWIYAVMNATYLRNRCYCQRIDNTPHWLIN